jgi:hypothetical protein
MFEVIRTDFVKKINYLNQDFVKMKMMTMIIVDCHSASSQSILVIVRIL